MTAPALTVTFLGTGSGAPSLERNLASVAVQRQGDLFLFDCGEAAQIQYRRAALGFAGLSAIFISHMHGDHVTGLMGLLMSLQMADRVEPLQVYGPPGLSGYVHACRRHLQTRFSFPLSISESSGAGCVLETDAYRVTTEPLDHRMFCLGYRFEEHSRPGRFDVKRARALEVPSGPLFGALQHGNSVELPDGRVIRPQDVLGPARPGASFAYCTDTRPCPGAVTLAQNVDLLIHEGTFEAGREDEARRKGHSTVADAARAAQLSGARQLVVTHLSPRYQDPSVLAAQARAIFPNTRIARDLMRVEIQHRETE